MKCKNLICEYSTAKFHRILELMQSFRSTNHASLLIHKHTVYTPHPTP